MGNGAREHVIAETFMRSENGCELGVFAKAVNPGLKALASAYTTGSFTDFTELKAFAKEFEPDFAFIGPDNPIADGAVDALLELGIKSVAPVADLARLESSKSFARDLLKKYELEFSKDKAIHKTVAKLLHKGEVVMWFQGRLEFGPRALGSRSILASAVDKNMQEKLNNIKQREQFRPFAITILETEAKKWLVRGTKSPYMLLVDSIKPKFKSIVPVAQHVDGSVRVHTVNEESDDIYYSLLEEYSKISGIPLFINTSLNIKGLPIVNNSQQAIHAFLESEDVKYLAIGEFLVTKKGG